MVHPTFGEPSQDRREVLRVAGHKDPPFLYRQLHHLRVDHAVESVLISQGEHVVTVSSERIPDPP